MATIRNSAPLQTITPSDAALAIVVSLVSAGWLATVHSATTAVAWSGWLGDLLVTGAVMAAMATAALLMVRGRAAEMPTAAGNATRAVAAAVAIGLVAAGTTAIRATALAGAGGNWHAHGGVGAHVLNHVLLTLAVVVPVALVAAALSEQVTPQAPAQHAPSATTPLAAVSRPDPRRRRLVAGVALSTTALVATMFGAPAPPAQAATTPAQACLTTGTPTKTFDIVAMDVDITLNAFGDHDPAGRMYALAAAVPAIRAAETSRKVTPGLRDDPIQPLVIRANQGDCVQINYTNNSAGAALGLHIDGLAFSTAGSGDELGANPKSAPDTGGSATYRYYVPNDPTLEGLHYMHPGPGYRNQVGHGLFGALAVEPPGSTYWSTSTPNTPLLSGWEAIIKPGGVNPSCVPSSGNCWFREYALLHHEVGNDNEKLFHPDGSDIPLVDDTTGSYRPGGFALNYRSEPFRNRIIDFPKEKSHSYSSYTFGEPATPVQRGYLADPTKIRIMHAGGEKFHVYHLHGGGDRWRANPVADTTFNYTDTGLRKDPDETHETPSQRLDSQAIGPGESFNLEIEGGAGGVQQSVGDFLYHCHIAKHYVSGMWSLWRVYNVLQPDLVPLGDRTTPPTAIDSMQLFNRTYPQTLSDGTESSVTLDTPEKLDEWIRRQLPPQGVPKSAQDASVWDWKVYAAPGAPLYLGAESDPKNYPDSPRGVINHPNLLAIDGMYLPLVSRRPRILFDPVSGRPAYPLLRPKIGTRPPFSGGGHSGTPYLSNTANSAATGAADPTSARADGLCPTGPGRDLRTYNVVAIEKGYDRTGKGDIDPEGKVFVLAQDKKDVLEGTKPVTPLAIRANQGDCVGITLTNEMTDAGAFDRWSKTTMHIHHVQFDVQGSDGVSAGFAYEHSVRPYKVEDAQLTSDAAAGATTVALSSVSKLIGSDANGQLTHPWIMIGQGTNTPEVRQVEAVDSSTLTVTLTQPLSEAHPSGEYAGTEFIQYRWYPDVVLDNVFWHDHVDGIHGWGHGLVGQLLVEPKGSQWLDPTTNEPVQSGTFVNIVPGADSPPLAPGVVEGAYRELVLWTIHDNDEADFSTVNLRANPFLDRPVAKDRFSSYTYGDPVTPLARIYPDEPLVIRTINVSPTVDTLHFQGARFAEEFRFDGTSATRKVGLADTLHHGVSEKYTVILNGKPAEEKLRPGDYMYFDGDQQRFSQGAWGIVRVLPGQVQDLAPLPGIAGPTGTWTAPAVTGKPAPTSTDIGNPCTTTQPVRSVSITASPTKLPGLNNRNQFAYVPTVDAAAAKAGTIPVEPLVLHAIEGDCLKVKFTNGLESPSGFALAGVDRLPGSSGITLGWGPNQSVAPGKVRNLVFSVPTARMGTVTIADMIGGPDAQKRGLYGALVIAPKTTVAGKKTTITDPVTGAARSIGSRVLVHVPGWRAPHYRDFTVIFADDDPRIGQDFMPYPSGVDTDRSYINYGRAGVGSGDGAFKDPGTSPWITSYAGDPLIVHAMVAPGSEASHVFSLGGLAWDRDWRQPLSNKISADAIGPWETTDALVAGGAGGWGQTAGDYFYGDLRRPFTEAGMWGLQRVLPADFSGGCPVRRVNNQVATC